MATSSRKNGPILPIASTFQRSILPSGRFCSSSSSYEDKPSVTGSGLYSSPSIRRSVSPTRVNLHGLPSPSPKPSVRFSIDRSISPGRSMTVSSRDQVVRRQSGRPMAKKTCLCSPTTHPGSFRCSMHKNMNSSQSISYSPNRLNIRRSAMTNSLVRIVTVEGDLVKRALAALIRPSSHHQRRRMDFQPRPSRLSIMSKADDL